MVIFLDEDHSSTQCLELEQRKVRHMNMSLIMFLHVSDLVFIEISALVDTSTGV